MIAGGVDAKEMGRTFNCRIGMVTIKCRRIWPMVLSGSSKPMIRTTFIGLENWPELVVLSLFGKKQRGLLSIQRQSMSLTNRGSGWALSSVNLHPLRSCATIQLSLNYCSAERQLKNAP